MKENAPFWRRALPISPPARCIHQRHAQHVACRALYSQATARRQSTSCLWLQGPSGCAAPDLAWRLKPDGYLKNILTAKVRALLEYSCCYDPVERYKQLISTLAAT